ncbi:hypothetical protein G3N55_08190 [Dissulfurirhabdus thermomarina]|uniref:Uncharacterized protein n=1 Tax=Dissulfurirhabdus thermomarina TaxID=1765737 RepID=A0A6N9TNG1_DISTH|nr:hypothetical protein [Dissulfurirhabdus thermomarina]NDY42821.1 hypothetical protein [Dissulfurirhabdus thermomarina]NMX22550.1 hypothetical protein [Dissulfurirhabdus thermomarina]
MRIRLVLCRRTKVCLAGLALLAVVYVVFVRGGHGPTAEHIGQSFAYGEIFLQKGYMKRLAAAELAGAIDAMAPGLPADRVLPDPAPIRYRDLRLLARAPAAGNATRLTFGVSYRGRDYRIPVTLRRLDGRWRVTAFEPVIVPDLWRRRRADR